MQKHHCKTCAKRDKYGNCLALDELIGKNADCWAWSDDPNWRVKVAIQTRAYQEGWRGGPLPEPFDHKLALANMGADIRTIMEGV